MPRIRDYQLRIASAGYLTSRAIFFNLRRYLTSYVFNYLESQPTHAIVLDVGCGQGPYRGLLENYRILGVNLDRIDASPEVVANGLYLPFLSGKFSVAICTQVIEHVTDPNLLLSEIGRCLEPNGLLVLSGPMHWPLHEEPHDYWRFTKYGLQHLLKKNGFELIEINENGYAIALAILALNQIFRGALFFPLRACLNLIGLLAESQIRIRHSTPNLSLVARRVVL